MPKLLECRAHTLPVSRAPLYSDRSAHLFDRRSSLTVRARASPDCRRPHARRSTYQNALLPERPTARTSVRPHTRAARPHPGSRACLPNVFTSLRAHPHAKGRAPQRCRAPIINVIFAKGRPCQVTWALTLGRATFPTSVPVVNVGACYLCQVRAQLHVEPS